MPRARRKGKIEPTEDMFRNAIRSNREVGQEALRRALDPSAGPATRSMYLRHASYSYVRAAQLFKRMRKIDG